MFKLVKEYCSYLDLKYLFFKCKKTEFAKKCEENTFNRLGMLIQIILVKLTLYLTEKYQNRTNTPFHFLANPR